MHFFDLCWTSLTEPNAQALWFALLAVFFAYCVYGITGFGSALVSVPLLTWFWPLTMIVPLILLLDIPSSLLHTWLNRKDTQWREIPPLILPILLGALLGAWLLQQALSPIWLAVLGVYIVWVGVRGLRASWAASTTQIKLSNTPQGHTWQRWFAGGAIGLVETLYGTAGPIIMMWMSYRLSDSKTIRATLPSAVALVCLLALAGAASQGLLNNHLLICAFVVLFPIALLGVAIGHRLANRLPALATRRFIYGLLIVSGLSQIVRAWP